MTAEQPDLWGDLSSAPVDDHTAAVLDLVEADRIHSDDRGRIDDAVRRVAMKYGGIVSTNHVRRELTNAHGLTVTPQTIGPRLRALTLSGVLADAGWETSTDVKGGNAGKPLRLRRWVGKP